ncbi:ubiquinol-cytochrome-c reductase complex assembly factor 1-like [Actinia tenebrosa]|uniref:Ubiquinol-cytochrome-c reductase complex assembly factor 1-like n=1 Tax=Actinia tenebrosa TaxID=6105 RepID=A0A6P8HL32_ACTTE|nr:ubiquinol-cytochrome-c reductase complex assembly factor 1-like [Actinia tenebrosa]XP_031556467.1 ubiquinol-cytochrome-c reductase complex assembly factor 1-like [Actinia tenebrosa]
MNSLCGCRVTGVLQLVGVAATRRSLSQATFRANYASLVNHAKSIQSRQLLIQRNRVPRTFQQTSRYKQITRHLSSVENPQGGGDGTMTATAPEPETLGTKIAKFVGRFSGINSRSSVLWRSAMTMYRSCIEEVNYDDFYEACSMPDTFQSWFMINQLHIWMCLVRLKAEGKDGQFMYRKLVEIMWQDVEARMKKIGEIDSTTARESLRELVQEFYGLIFAYDEGLLSHDRVLAAALWRNMFYDKRQTDASQLANLVKYVRRQVQHLDNLDPEELLTTGKVPWLPFRTAKEQPPFLYQSYHAN